MNKDLRLPKKCAILSNTLPPAINGQAIILERLLRDMDPSSYILISADPKGIGGDDCASQRLDAPYCILPSEDGPRWVPRTLKALSKPIRRIRLRATRVKKLLETHECDCLIACTNSIINIPAGFLAARQLGIPFIAFVLDYFALQNDSVPGVNGLARKLFARAAERLILPRSSRVMVLNEFLRDIYKTQYGIDAAIVRNPLDPAAEAPKSPGPWPRKSGKVRILYTGAVYVAQVDALTNLATAVESLSTSLPAEAVLVTPTKPDVLREVGLLNRLTVEPAVSVEEVPRIQREADVLFLPLAFRSPFPQLIRTSAPGKMPEYMLSGRPILVHAPKDAFLSWYFRKHHCGWVVDQDDPQALAQALRQIADDPEDRARRVQQALIRAEQDFSVVSSRRAFCDAIAAV